MTMPNKKEPVPAPAKKPAGSIYSLGQLVREHKALGASREIVAVALKKTGKPSFTISEARGLVNKFKNQEVK